MFAQESGMDLQKEREAFEKECRLLCYKGNMVMSNLGSFYNNEQTNWMWQMWLSAKAQAVPKLISVGDSLPPVDETVLVCWDYAADIEPEKEYLTLDEDYNEYWPNCQDEPPTHWLPLPKVIKAQEKANEL